VTSTTLTSLPATDPADGIASVNLPLPPSMVQVCALLQ
jgi:hypothetical protein